MNKYLISILVAITAVCSMGQTLRYGSMKSDYLVVTNEQDTTALTALYGSGVVWRASWYTENVDRVSGDLKGSNYAYTIYTVLTGDVARASSDGSNYVTAVRAELTNSIKAVSNLVSAIPAQTNITHNSLLGIGGAGTLHVSASETNLIAGSLQRSGGTMTGDLTMGTNAVSGRRFGNSAGDGVSGIFWNAYGGSAGLGASGSGWCAYGDGAGAAASGDNWTAYGLSSGYAAVGDNWGAYGERSGQLTIHTNSHAFGRYAGRTARGNNRMYLDVYAANPAYPADGATNDTLFMDSDGKLYLGGGAGRAENPSAGGVLRGPWQGTGMTNVPIAGVSGLTDALAGKLGTNATPGSIGAVSNTPAGIAEAGGIVTNTAINLGTNHLTVTTIKPVTNSTTAIQITKADGTNRVVTIDTLNNRVGFGMTPDVNFGVSFGANFWANGQSKATGLAASPSSTGYDLVSLRYDGAYGNINAYNNATRVIYLDANPAKRSYFNVVNFGFGTTNPTERVHVNGSAIIETNLTVNGSATVGGLQVATVEQVVTGEVVTVSSGNRYFFTTATNVTLTASLTGGQVINYIALRNTATNSVTAIGDAGWKWTGGAMTNTIPASTMMTFGFACNPFTGVTNAYATAASVN